MNFRRIAIAAFLSLAGLLILSACVAPFPGRTSTTSQPVSVADPNFLIGTWSGKYNNQDVSITFDPSGGIGLAYAGSLHSGTYKLNRDTTPFQIDLDFGTDGVEHTIIEFVDSNTIKIENVLPGEPLPTKFSDYFTLTRFDQ